MTELLGLSVMTLALAASAVPAVFELTPRILRVGTEARLTIRAADPAALREGAEYRVRITPMEWKGDGASREPTTLTLRAAGGALSFTFRGTAEQEYACTLLDGEGKKTLAEFRFYAVEAELFARRPYKGDVHQHSNRSDGKDEPAYVAAFNRKIGMDFMALTDHRQYAPSLEAIRAFAGLPIDLRLYPGEEVHAPGTEVHIVNFGGRASVNELFKQPRCAEEVKKLAASLKGLPAERDAASYAACLWSFAEIRRVGGISIFCHPYWVTGSRYNVPEALIERMFAEKPFDAYELIGGYWLHQSESNALQVARYYAEGAAGRRVPVVGVSDGHGTAAGLHGWYYTLVLARSPDLEDLREAILGDYSVAVEHLPGAPAARPFGPFRLLKYTSFLLREVMPRHDALCAEEGEAMLAHVAGDAGAAARLKGLQGRVQALYARLWAGEAARA